MKEAIHFKVVYLEQNMGHGNARRKSVDECTNNLVALMDADDIAVSDRFEKQLNLFSCNPQLSIVGGQIAEFVGTEDNIVGIREVPLKDEDIKKYMQKRCPMNQVTVMFRKDDFKRAGGYIDWYCEEDYYLWARMALCGCTFGNVSDILCNVRVGNQMSARRGGIKYFKSEKCMQKFLLENHLITLFRYCFNVLIRFLGEVAAPNALRVRLFGLFRKKVDNGKKYFFLNEAKKNGKDCIIKKWPPFSVAMCVYGGDNAEWFNVALKSIIFQTVKPQEIVLVVDGPISDEIQKVIDKYLAVCNCDDSV